MQPCPFTVDGGKLGHFQQLHGGLALGLLAGRCKAPCFALLCFALLCFASWQFGARSSKFRPLFLVLVAFVWVFVLCGFGFVLFPFSVSFARPLFSVEAARRISPGAAVVDILQRFSENDKIGQGCHPLFAAV